MWEKQTSSVIIKAIKQNFTKVFKLLYSPVLYNFNFLILFILITCGFLDPQENSVHLDITEKAETSQTSDRPKQTMGEEEEEEYDEENINK